MTKLMRMITVLVLCSVGALFGEYAGTVRFIDLDGNEDRHIQKNEHLHVEVVDYDLNKDENSKETVTILVKSNTEVIHETMTLIETDNNSGTFTGTFTIENVANATLDGKLQAQIEDYIQVTYEDSLNDYDEHVTIVDSIAYGFSELPRIIDQSHTITKNEGAFFISEMITIEKDAFLKIEPGVKIITHRDCNKSFLIKGAFVAHGTEADSIYFYNEGDDNKSWDLLEIYQSTWDDPDSVMLSYVTISDSRRAITSVYSPKNLKLEVKNCNLSKCKLNPINFRVGYNCTILIENSQAAISFDYIDDHANIIFRNNLVNPGLTVPSDNWAYGVNCTFYNDSDSGSLIIENNKIINNTTAGSAIRINSNKTTTGDIAIKGNTVENCSYGLFTLANVKDIEITGNTFKQCSIGVYTYVNKLSYNNFIECKTYNIQNNKGDQIDARYNYWGKESTAEIITGGNPKNITKIYDNFDVGKYGIVNYSQWLTEPYVEKPLEITKQPVNISASENKMATFKVQTSGGNLGNISSQWYFNNDPIPGANSQSYSFIVTPADTGAAYTCKISDGTTSLTTSKAYLTITPSITIDIDTNTTIDTTFNASEDTVITEIITIKKITTIPKDLIEGIKKVSTGNHSSSSILFAPNPAPSTSDAISFIIPEGKDGEWTINIYDALGNSIDEQTIKAKAGEIYQWDLKNKYGQRVTAGSYLVGIAIRYPNGKTEKSLQYIGVKS